MSEGSPLPEALVLCPVCSQGVGPRDFEQHLQRQHGLYTYQGVRRTRDDTLDALRLDLLADPPSELAWQTVSRLARDEWGDDADASLARWLADGLKSLPESRRESILEALAIHLGAEQPNLLLALAQRPEVFARSLSVLALLESRRPERAPVALLRRLLKDRTLADAPLLRLVIRLLTALPDAENPLAARILRWFLHERESRPALRLLRHLLRRLGPHPLVAAALERRQPRTLLACPRCGVQGDRAAMERHLWQEHRLVLDGLQVRDPWEVVEQWATRARDEPHWRDRCRLAAQRLDPVAGLERVERLLLLHHTAEPERHATYLRRATHEHAAVCPWCYALVPVPQQLAPQEVIIEDNQLLASGYEVRLSERGLAPAVRLIHPGESLRWVPLSGWTPSGALFVFSGPVVLVALLLAALWPESPLGLVAGMLGVAALVGLFAWLLTRPGRSLAARLLDCAWEHLVPRLFTRGYEAEDARFVAGLARLSSDQDRDDLPDEPIGVVLGILLAALEARKADPEHVAVVARLVAESGARRGTDPVTLVERWVALAFEGRIPLSFVQALLADWRADFWTAGQLARLRLRVLDRAFEAGFEVQGLLDAGQNAPALGAVMGIDAPRRLAALRLLWSLRATRPWERLGEVRTAFELAAVPGRIGILERHGDVLLWCEDGTPVTSLGSDPDALRPAEIQCTLAGVWLNEELFATPPREIETQRRGEMQEMLLHRIRFRSPNDLDPLVRRLERWFRYVFLEFLPRVDEARHWNSPAREAVLRAWGAVPCPQCQRYLLPRVGEVGIGVEETHAPGPRV